jgi:hypothetical protein
MSSEIIQNVAYENYDDFNISTSYFHKISFHYFEDYLTTKLNLGWVSLQGEDTKSHLIGKLCILF